jgi:hypothetical protein
MSPAFDAGHLLIKSLRQAHWSLAGKPCSFAETPNRLLPNSGISIGEARWNGVR